MTFPRRGAAIRWTPAGATPGAAGTTGTGDWLAGLGARYACRAFPTKPLHSCRGTNARRPRRSRAWPSISRSPITPVGYKRATKDYAATAQQDGAQEALSKL